MVSKHDFWKISKMLDFPSSSDPVMQKQYLSQNHRIYTSASDFFGFVNAASVVTT